MSLPPERWPGFWNRVTSASTSRKMTTHRAKLRKFGFIGPVLPSREVDREGPQVLARYTSMPNLGMPHSLAKGSGTACVIVTDSSITAPVPNRFKVDPKISVPVEIEHAARQRQAQGPALLQRAAQAPDGPFHAL